MDVTTRVRACGTLHRHTPIRQRLHATMVVSPATTLYNVEVNPRAIYKGHFVVTELGFKYQYTGAKTGCSNGTHNFRRETGIHWGQGVIYLLGTC